MSDDLLEPEVSPLDDRTLDDEDRRDDDAPGIEGEEHLGLTPPD